VLKLWVAAFNQLPRKLFAQRRSFNGENCIMPALRQLLIVTSLPKLFLQGNPTPACSKPRAGNSSNWHTSSKEYFQTSARKMHWRWYGYFNNQESSRSWRVYRKQTPKGTGILLSLSYQFTEWWCGNKSHNPPYLIVQHG